MLTGLLFVFGWEPVILVVPGYLKKFTVAYYLQALVPHAMPADSSAVSLLTSLFKDSPSLPVALVMLAVLGVGLLASRPGSSSGGSTCWSSREARGGRRHQRLELVGLCDELATTCGTSANGGTVYEGVEAEDDTRTRNFMIGSAAILVAGFGVGLVAYYGGIPGHVRPAGRPVRTGLHARQRRRRRLCQRRPT